MRAFSSIVLIFITLWAFAQNNPHSSRLLASEYYSQASVLLEANDYQKARDLFAKAVDLNDQISDYHNGKGVANFYLNNMDEAEIDFENAIQIDPTQANFYYYLANISQKQKNYQKAITTYWKAVDRNISSDVKVDAVNSKFQIGVCYIKLKDYEMAIRIFDEILLEKPLYRKAFVNRGIASGYMQNLDQACEDFSRAAELGSTAAVKYLEKYCGRATTMLADTK